VIAREPIWISLAVNSLVAGADQPRGVGEGGRSHHDPLPDQRVAAHEFPLPLVERTGLVEDRRRDRRLADIMQLRRQDDPSDLVRGLAERCGDGAGKIGDALDVIVQECVLFGDHLQQRIGHLPAGR